MYMNHEYSNKLEFFLLHSGLTRYAECLKEYHSEGTCFLEPNLNMIYVTSNLRYIS